MKCESFWEGPEFVVRVSGERRRKPVLNVLGGVAFAGLVQFLRVDRWVRIGAVCLGGTYAAFKVCEVEFGVSEMRISDAEVAFVLRVLAFSRRRAFPRSDIEKLGYLKGYKDEPPAFGIMIRTLMMPLRFGWGISHHEASSVLETLRKSQCWIGKKTIQVDQALF